ncbi:mitochondrial import inner membrane translocase subunit Tim10, partial [Cladochytrium replicatum]
NFFISRLSTCHRKCIPTEYVQGDLNKGESVCVDRCVMKYFAVQTKVMEFQKNQALQQQSIA